MTSLIPTSFILDFIVEKSSLPGALRTAPQGSAPHSILPETAANTILDKEQADLSDILGDLSAYYEIVGTTIFPSREEQDMCVVVVTFWRNELIGKDNHVLTTPTSRQGVFELFQKSSWHVRVNIGPNDDIVTTVRFQCSNRQDRLRTAKCGIRLKKVGNEFQLWVS